MYGQVFTRGPGAPDAPKQMNVWKLIRATTRDGSRFENVETVFEAPPGSWTDHLGLAYNPDAREFLALKLKVDDGGFAYRAYLSSHGRSWAEHPGNPLFYDGDSLGLFWSPNAHRFVCTSKTLQPVLKHIPDHGGTHPQLIHGMVLFHFGDQLLGLKQDRISYVGARANGEFSTAQFAMPDADLFSTTNNFWRMRFVL